MFSLILERIINCWSKTGSRAYGHQREAEMPESTEQVVYKGNKASAQQTIFSRFLEEQINSFLKCWGTT